LECAANLLWRIFFIFTKNKIMALVCLTDLIYKGKKYREGDAIKVDPAKVSVFIAKGWASRPDSALNEIKVDVKEVKAKRETKEFKVEVNTKDDEADQD
jgi:predicted transcriptional regulator